MALSPLGPEPEDYEARLAWWRAKADELTPEGLREAVPIVVMAWRSVVHPMHGAYLKRVQERCVEAGLIDVKAGQGQEVDAAH